MQKTLIYNGKQYDDFLVSSEGKITNRKTNHTYKNCVNKAGYLNVYLPMGERGRVKAVRVHKAVAETFIPNPNNLPVVHHIDGDKRNAHYTNLKWVSFKENTLHYHDELRKSTPYFNNRKLTKEDVVLIREKYENGMSIRSIAKMFSVSHPTIVSVIHENSYCE